MPRVLISPRIDQNCPADFLDILKQGGFETVTPPRDAAIMNPDVLSEMLEGIDAIVASVEPLSREVLSKSTLRAVARRGVGFDAVDVPAASELGIVVTITPGTLEDSVAEHTIALMFGVARGLVVRDRKVRAGDWSRSPLPRLSGKTLGVVGMGRIGRAVVGRAQGLGMTVIATDPFADEQFAAEHDVRLCSLDELLAQSDVVSLNLLCTPENVDLINADALAKMKQGSILVNTARGGLVDEQALYEALTSGHLAGAGLDVFKSEPLPLDSPLLRLDNVVATNHTAGFDEESAVAVTKLAAQCLVDLYQGRWPEKCVVNGDIREGWKW